MSRANRAIKARGKSSPDRIQQDIRNAKVVRVGDVSDNDFVHIAETETLAIADFPSGNISVPLNFWLENKSELCKSEDAHDGSGGRIVAVQVASDEDPFALASDLNDITMIVLPFVMFVDGRGYSHATNLRLKMSFKGEIRAVGDVHFDQLGFLARVGVDAFEMPDEEDHQYAQKAFAEFSEVYQPAADGKPLIFSRRRTIQ